MNVWRILTVSIYLLLMLLILTIVLEHKCPENYTDSMYVLFLLLIPNAVLEGKCLEKVYCFYACALHIDCVYLEHEVLEDFTVSMHELLSQMSGVLHCFYVFSLHALHTDCDSRT